MYIAPRLGYAERQPVFHKTILETADATSTKMSIQKDDTSVPWEVTVVVMTTVEKLMSLIIKSHHTTELFGFSSSPNNRSLESGGLVVI